MKTLLSLALVVAGVAIVALFVWRQLDHRADRAEMDRLIATQPMAPAAFDASMVADLPEPAQRFLTYAIAEGTPLYTVAEIEMQGQFSLGSREAPNYMDMEAVQVLAAPVGFVWKMSGGSGLMRMSGSDSGSWTRFWMAGILPVGRFGGNPDHSRSAFGRYVAESAFWTPAALLPGTGTVWEAVDENTARFVMTHLGLTQAVDMTVASDGRPTQVVFERWSDANPVGVHQLQPFGGYLSEFQDFQGFRVPTHIEAGNFFGTEDYFPFFIADITTIRFPTSGDE
ncbi:hypothetical protein A8B78_10075 [Jannaschia sp. EhC01]|nr:hypothetical protein A8B78_10075 [Jannaschia sp. EhC01]